MSRVDIQIDDASFFLILEVKINAPEQPEQLKRYCEIAFSRSGNRPCAVIFLTPEGRLPTTAGDQIDFVIPLSWHSIAASLRRAARQSFADRSRKGIPSFLANAFATHISDF